MHALLVSLRDSALAPRTPAHLVALLFGDLAPARLAVRMVAHPGLFLELVIATPLDGDVVHPLLSLQHLLRVDFLAFCIGRTEALCHRSDHGTEPDEVERVEHEIARGVEELYVERNGGPDWRRRKVYELHPRSRVVHTEREACEDVGAQ